MVGKGAITVKSRLEAARVTADAGAETVVPHSLGLARKTTTVQATAQSLPISVLDLVPTRPGEPAGRAIARSVDWLQRHSAVSAEDFAKDASRNRFAILLSRTNHLSYHLGRTVLGLK